MKNQSFEVIIVGGSYSGLAAAMSLGRSLRNTLVIDSGEPCNRFTPHSQNFLTQDGRAPGEIAAIARNQVLKYNTVKFLDDLVVSGMPRAGGFQIETWSGKVFQTQKLVFATGVRDIFPDLEGFEDCWGKSIIHCPYCHGYEFRGQKTAIWVNAENSGHLVPLVRNLTRQVTVLTNGDIQLSNEELTKFKKHGVKVVEKRITGISHKDGQLKSIAFEDSQKQDFDAMYAGLRFEQHCTVPAAMGCELTDKGHIKTDMFFKTSIEGVYACGDNVSPLRSVANAVANGSFAGASINRELAVMAFQG